MHASLDKYGRIVIPHDIREDSGLKPGDALEISWSGTEIRIKPVLDESPLMVREGILVYEAKAGIQEEAVEQDRIRRMRKILESNRA